jgi:hypothetical protein
MRAEIRVGELLTEMAERGERDIGRGGDRKSQSHSATVKLDDLGVTKSQSSRWQQLAALPQDEREERIERAKHRAVSAIDGTKPPRDTAGTGENEWYTPQRYIDAARVAWPFSDHRYRDARSRPRKLRSYSQLQFIPRGLRSHSRCISRPRGDFRYLLCDAFAPHLFTRFKPRD